MRHFQILLLCSCLFVVAACSSGPGEDASSGTLQTSTTTTTAPEKASTTDSNSVEPTTTTMAEPGEPETSSTQATNTTSCGLVVTVMFDEGAPRDGISIRNESTADISLASARIDLSTSAGGIIFDTLDGGSGVEVFQDFQVEGGDAVLANEPVAEDGATDIRLEFDTFSVGESFDFSIDVDDQLTDSDLGQIQVTGAEIAGALVVVTTIDGSEVTGVFDQANSAQILADC